MTRAGLRDAVVVPSTPALLAAYAGLEDPVAELRAACVEAVGWLVDRHPDRIALVCSGLRPADAARGVVEPAGLRVGRELLSAAGFAGEVPADPEGVAGVLVLANGSATRSEKAPGFLDDRSFAFDEAIGSALDMGDPQVLRVLDVELGEELWAYDVPAFRRLGVLASRPVTALMTYADDRYGVQYWVARWTCGS